LFFNAFSILLCLLKGGGSISFHFSYNSLPIKRSDILIGCVLIIPLSPCPNLFPVGPDGFPLCLLKGLPPFTPGTPSNSDWAQGYQLANQMNFKFPHFSPTHLSQVQYTHLSKIQSLTFPRYSTLTFQGTVYSPSKVQFTHLSQVQYTHLPRYSILTFQGTVHSPSQQAHLSQVRYTPSAS